MKQMLMLILHTVGTIYKDRMTVPNVHTMRIEEVLVPKTMQLH